jgi:hypothetical protein
MRRFTKDHRATDHDAAPYFIDHPHGRVSRCRRCGQTLTIELEWGDADEKVPTATMTWLLEELRRGVPGEVEQWPPAGPYD